MEIPFPDEKFERCKAVVALVPAMKANGVFGLNLTYSFSKNIAITILYGKCGEKIAFSPWKKMKDMFGGDTFINEMTNRRGVVESDVYPFGLYGKFVRDRSSAYPKWTGYFDSHYQANREWRTMGMKEVRHAAEWERMLTPELDSALKSLKFGRVR